MTPDPDAIAPHDDAPLAEDGIDGIKERERLEAENTHLRQTVVDLSAALNDAAHDLREPTRALIGFSELLSSRLGDDVDEKVARHLRFIVAGGHRLEELTEDLLEFGRLLVAVPEPTDTDLAVEAERAAGGLEHARIEIGALPTLRVDAPMVRRMFRHLFDNAVEYRRGDDPVRVSVTATPQRGGWVVSVVDDGMGVPPERHEYVFTPFKRLHSRSEHPGSGLGLAVCRQIMQLHGGTATMTDAPPRGVNVGLWFPPNAVA